jgi:hypothetical protein
MSIEVITAVIGLVLTLLIFSYLIGDNPLFRFAVYLFIGSASGYAAAVVCYQLLFPKLQSLSLSDPLQLIIRFIPFFLGATLLAKLLPRISWIGNFAMAVLVGVGAATAVGGALIGTLIPQALTSMEGLNFRTAGTSSGAFYTLFEGAIMLIGTILTLIYFQFSANRKTDGSTRRNAIIEFLALLGRVFISITFGVLFAGVYMSALTAMIERLSSLINFVK